MTAYEIHLIYLNIDYNAFQISLFLLVILLINIIYKNKKNQS